MTSQGTTKSIGGALLFVICFLIACIFLYWAVEYWTDRNGDRGRYEIYKIQGAEGADSWSFWKLDRRAGRVEYCRYDIITNPNGTKTEDFSCVRAKSPEDKKKEMEERQASGTAPVEDTSAVVTTTTAPAPADSEAVVTTTVPEVTATPAN
jgi:hypothetical protein